jgi:hypothetical protein
VKANRVTARRGQDLSLCAFVRSGAAINLNLGDCDPTVAAVEQRRHKLGVSRIKPK